MNASRRFWTLEEEYMVSKTAELLRTIVAVLYSALTRLEVGPLSDFSQLVGFEDAAGGIGAMSEISVKRFKQGRATLAMRFKQPVELLRELEDRAPFVFKVRDRRSDRLVRAHSDSIDSTKRWRTFRARRHSESIMQRS